MQYSTEDGIRMVGMDQCRISSVESNASSTDPLLENGSRGSNCKSTASRVPTFYSQKSRGSHSSGGSCSGAQDECCSTGGTEQEPLIPRSKNQLEKEESSSLEPVTQAHVNKLHFVLFEQCQDDNNATNGEDQIKRPDQNESKKTKSAPENSLDLSDMVRGGENLVGSEPNEKKRTKPDHVRMQHGSKETVCSSSSSSSTTATAMAASTHSSNKSSNHVANSRGNGRSGNNRERRLRHLSTDTDDTSDISATLEPPDGGWGWVVVAASFLVNCIADGVTFSFGVFFLEFTNFFKESESTTAWIGSLLAAIPLLSGPIASSAVDRYGCRNVTVVGGLLAAFGFLLSSYTTCIYVLMLTFGVITGFGLSLCYVAAVVIVAYYFERRRSFATGLSVCGGGIGTFLFAPISQHLIDHYGWQKTTRILAGTFLGLCLCGLLMKDLEWTKKKNKGTNNNNSSNHQPYNLPYSECNGDTMPCHHHHHHHCTLDNASNEKNNSRRCNSAICIPTFVQEQERRERRQRYYSCNQDYDGEQTVKPDVIEISSPKRSSRKGRNNSTKTRILQQINSNKCDAQVECNGETFAGILPVCSSSPLPDVMVMGLEVCGSPMPIPDENIMKNDPVGPCGDAKYEIPEEKDNKSISTVTNNTEIVDLAQNNNISRQHKLSRSGSDSSSSRRIIVAHTELVSCNSNSRKESVNDGSESNSNRNSLNRAVISNTPPASSSDLFNYHNNIQLPNGNYHSHNDSNNSSCTNLNNNITHVGKGLMRDNSGSSSRRFLYRNKSFNNSINSNSATKDVTATSSLQNGIPSIIIPPGQQLKSNLSSAGHNVKLEVMNSVSFRRGRSVTHRHSLTYRGAVLNLKRYRLRPASSCPDIISVATSTEGHGSFEFVNVVGDACRWLQSVCEWENLINTRFLLFILSNLLLYTWYDVPYMYLQTAAVRHGYSEDLSSYLISSIGLFNVVGNIFLGYLGDKEWASATIVYGVCMILCGLTTVLMPYLMEWSYWGLFTICGVFGLTIAANYALTSVILVQVVSLERFANAYGLLLLVQGIGNLVGPPIAGVISDMTGTNTWSFLVAGVGIFASSFFVLAPIFQRDEPQHPPTHVGHNATV